MLNNNESNRKQWIKERLAEIPAGLRILDAGAGDLGNKKYCQHLQYVSQDFCEYHGSDGGAPNEGMQLGSWDTSHVDLVSDISSIPAPDKSFDAILCSEVLEHIPEPTLALDEFSRLLRDGGVLVLTAPFSSNVHMAPYHFCTGFSKYWYEHHLTKRGFNIKSLTANGDWYDFIRQEIARLGGLERSKKNMTWPIAYLYSLFGLMYFKIRQKKSAQDLACFGWQCVAIKVKK